MTEPAGVNLPFLLPVESSPGPNVRHSLAPVTRHTKKYRSRPAHFMDIVGYSEIRMGTSVNCDVASPRTESECVSSEIRWIV